MKNHLISHFSILTSHFLKGKQIMGTHSIVTKIVISVCGIVSVLLILGTVVLIKFESDLVKTFVAEHKEKISRSLDDRAKSENISLEEKIRFTLDVLNRFGGVYIYHYESEELKNSLKVLMRPPEILAIKVLNEKGEPFAAAWKAPDITVGDSFPDFFSPDDKLSVHAEAISRNEKIGSFRIYYSYAGVAENIKRIKSSLLADAEAFRNTAHERTERAILSQSLGILAILAILCLCLIVTLRFTVLRPVRLVSDVARRLADFDLTASVNTGTGDEIGNLLDAVGTMAMEFRKIVGDVKSCGKRLSDASELMTGNIASIASAAGEMSLSTGQILKTTEALSRNSSESAAAIEEMSASVATVGKNARHGLDIAEEAVKMAEKAGRTMTALGQAAKSIGEVTEVIKGIADKTSLLALNADIEAASAGEAGRGFAVVANEIKIFARQSTQAADDIAANIAMMQKNTKEAVEVIGDVSGIINTLNRSSESISYALEEQTKAANAISLNALETNTAANEIASLMAQLAQLAKEISLKTGRAAGEKTKTGESDVRYMDASAAELARLAKELLDLVDKFKVE